MVRTIRNWLLSSQKLTGDWIENMSSSLLVKEIGFFKKPKPSHTKTHVLSPDPEGFTEQTFRKNIAPSYRNYFRKWQRRK